MHVLFVILLFLYSFTAPRPALAHGSGFPPFFKIDGKIANTYFLQNVGVFSSSITIPQDSAEKNYLPDESIEFEIDKVPLESVFAPEVMDKLTFAWDFGDGSKATGIKNEHTYHKPGSYILTINVDYGDPNAAPLLIESVLIQVLPAKNYLLPKPIITVNGKQGTKKDYNILDFDLKNSLSFDGSQSKASSKIVSYQWDFGDDNTGSGSSVTHKYQLPQAFATIVLRVTDEKGLFADQVVNIRNSGSNEPPQNNFPLKKITLGSIIMLVIIVMVIAIRKKK